MHTAIVTGGTRGIGRAIAAALAGAGHAVMLTGRNAEQVVEAEAEVHAFSPCRAGFSTIK